MPVLDLSFEWPVDDAGYKIVDRKRKPSEGRDTLSMLRHPDGPYIVRGKGPLRTTRPLELHRTLFMAFARLDGSYESYLQFANSFGFLGLFPNKRADDRVGPKGESLVLWQYEINLMRDAVELWQASPDTFASNQELIITELQVSLVPIDGKATLRIRPTSLIGAIRMQFAQAVATDLDIRTCDHCRKIFETGGMGRTRKARFCSDKCRNDYHLAKRKVK